MNKLSLTKPVLILLYGYPGSGKTYFSRQLSEQLNVAHLQADRIRSELFDNPRFTPDEDRSVYRIMNYLTEELLNAGVSVVYDSNAMRTAQRRALREMAIKAKAQELLMWFQIDGEGAFTRVAGRDRRRSDSKYSRPLDRTTFDFLLQNMQNPASHEPYIVVSGKHTFKTQYNTLSKRLMEIGVMGANDVNGPMIKPGLVNLVPSAGLRSNVDRRNIFIR